MKKRGFTLIELIIVIAIIGLLAVIVLVALNTAKAKSRDASRKTTVHQIESALELYYADNASYPPSDFNAPESVGNLSTYIVPKYIPSISYDDTNVSGGVYYRPASPVTNTYLIYESTEQLLKAPNFYGCLTGVGPVVTNSGLYANYPLCEK
jgi:prepilin-type N-terminal cleavage/methylation domain-containing protein